MKVKKIRLIWVIIFFIIILGILGMYLYLKTDLFKSKEVLFKKYFFKNTEDIVNILDFSKQSDSINKLVNNDYTETTNISLKYIDKYEREEIYNIEEKGIINNSEKSSYRKALCKYKNRDIIDIELLKQNNMYGFRLTNLIKQFVSIENNNLSQLVSNIGLNGEYLDNNIKLNNINLIELIQFSKEEINTLKGEYIKLIFENLDKNNYSSKSNSLITLNNGQSVTTKSYTLTINQNDLNNICKRIINKAIDDEILLNKINQIENTASNIGIKNIEKLQDKYKSKLQQVYDSMDYKGEDENKYSITIYVKDNEVLRIYIKAEDLEYYIEKDFKQENAMSLKIVKLTNEGTDSKTFMLVNNNLFEYKYSNNDSNYIDLKLSDEDESNNYRLTANINYESEKIKLINVLLETKYDFSNKENINVNFEKNKNIILNKYDKEKIQSIGDNLEKIIIKSLKESQEKIQSDMLENIIESIDNKYNEILEKRKEEFEEKKNTFNNKFLLYEGEKVEYENIKKLLYVVGKNMKEYKVSEDKKIKIYLEENKENSEKANNILKLLTEKDLYNVKINYLENGMIDSIDLSIYKENKED